MAMMARWHAAVAVVVAKASCKKRLIKIYRKARSSVLKVPSSTAGKRQVAEKKNTSWRSAVCHQGEEQGPVAVGRQGGFKHFSHEDGPELGSVWGGVPLMTNILFTI